MLYTTRLQLKGVAPADIHHLFNTQTKADIMAFFGCNEKGYERLQLMHEKGMETFSISQFSFLLYEKDCNVPIGECGFHTWNRTHRRADIFYALNDDAHKNKGFMREALPEVLDYGFQTLGLHRVQAFIDPANTPSLRLLLQNGFQKEGIAREDYVVDGVSEDSHCYSLLKTEFKKR